MPPTGTLSAVRADDQFLTRIARTNLPTTTLDRLLVAWRRRKRAEIARTVTAVLGGAR